MKRSLMQKELCSLKSWKKEKMEAFISCIYYLIIWNCCAGIFLSLVRKKSYWLRIGECDEEYNGNTAKKEELNKKCDILNDCLGLCKIVSLTCSLVSIILIGIYISIFLLNFRIVNLLSHNYFL